MRIISKFKDYYDGIQSLGQDSSMIYFRKTETVDPPTENEIDKFLHEQADYHNVIRIRKANCVGSDIYICKVILGFCGQLITCSCVHWPKEDMVESLIFFYSRLDLIKYLKKQEKVLHLEDLKFKSRISWQKKESMDWEEFISDFEQINGDHDQIFHALKKPIFIYPSFIFDYELIRKNKWIGNIHSGKSKIIVDPMLKSIGFQRIKDAYQCYQILEQYLNGVLGNTEKGDDNRSDLEKVRSHGFDEKYGFRTRKKE